MKQIYDEKSKNTFVRLNILYKVMSFVCAIPKQKLEELLEMEMTSTCLHCFVDVFILSGLMIYM